jgi:hypothetical protein
MTASAHQILDIMTKNLAKKEKSINSGKTMIKQAKVPKKPTLKKVPASSTAAKLNLAPDVDPVYSSRSAFAPKSLRSGSKSARN